MTNSKLLNVTGYEQVLNVGYCMSSLVSDLIYPHLLYEIPRFEGLWEMSTLLSCSNSVCKLVISSNSMISTERCISFQGDV